MSHDDWRASAPTATPAPPAAGKRRARWPWVLGGALLLLTGLLAAAAVAAWALIGGVLDEVVGPGVGIVVNGHRWEDLHPEHLLAALAGMGLAGLAVMGALLLVVGLIVPLVLSLVLLSVGLVVTVGLGAVGVALAVGLTPLWLPLLLLWWLLRPARRPLASSAA